jgi:opacity protein-like surface antigen
MDFKMKKVVLGSVLLLAMSSVHAAESPRWDSAALSYQSADLDGDKLNGFGLSGSKLLGTNVFVSGSYSSVSDKEYGVNWDYNTMSLGLGYRTALTQNTDFFGVVSYEDVELEASSGGFSDSGSENGYGLAVGVRSMLTDKFELNGGFKYIDIAEESDTALSVGALYNFTNQFSAGVGITKSDDIDTVSVSAVYYF